MRYKYKIENLTFPELKERAVVEPFQRKLVWSTNEKKSFIETLSNGHPFGAILIYKYEDKDNYSIIDGLQRYTTITDYEDNPQKYIQFDSIVDEKILNNFINKEKVSESTIHNARKVINSTVESFTSEALKGNSSVATLYKMLKDELPDIFSNLSADELMVLEEIKDSILKTITNHLDVDSLPIPTIVFYRRG